MQNCFPGSGKPVRHAVHFLRGSILPVGDFPNHGSTKVVSFVDGFEEDETGDLSAATTGAGVTLALLLASSIDRICCCFPFDFRVERGGEGDMFTLNDVVEGGVAIISSFVEDERGEGLSVVNSIPDNFCCNSSSSRNALVMPCGVVAPSTFATNS